MRMTERDEKQNWRQIQILFFVIKITFARQKLWACNVLWLQFEQLYHFLNLRHILHSTSDSSNVIKNKNDTSIYCYLKSCEGTE